MTNIQLGQKVRDKVTGFEGIVLARTEWLNGCIRILLQPRVGSDGKIPDTVQFDEPQLEVIDDGIREVAKETRRDTGGPIPTPTQQQKITR